MDAVVTALSSFTRITVLRGRQKRLKNLTGIWSADEKTTFWVGIVDDGLYGSEISNRRVSFGSSLQGPLLLHNFA
jgi:hypothetical protein